VPQERPTTRGHLRLATAPPAPRSDAPRPLLLVRAAAAFVVWLWLGLAARLAAAVALLPLALRRGPLHPRAGVPRVREARVIPFQRPRREPQRALPR
jgi:hypothetical protein